MQKTYQDLLEVGEREDQRMEFVRSLIQQRSDDPLYKTAVIADQYDRHQNVTIKQIQNLRVTRLMVQVHEKMKEPDEIDWEGEDKDEKENKDEN